MADALIVARPVDPDLQRARAAAAEALSALTDKQRLYVETFVADGNSSAALLAAGYSESVSRTQPHLIKRNPTVRKAIQAMLRLRTAEQEFTRQDTLRYLREMLQARIDDLAEINDRGVLTGLRDFESLPTAVQARVKRMTARVHRSAKGERAHYVTVDIQLHSPLEVLDRLARLEGWVSDSPQFKIALAQIQAAPAEQHEQSFALIHGLAEILLPGDRHDEYLLAMAEGRQDQAAALLVEGARELAAAAGVAAPIQIPAEASHE